MVETKVTGVLVSDCLAGDMKRDQRGETTHKRTEQKRRQNKGRGEKKMPQERGRKKKKVQHSPVNTDGTQV